MDLLTLIPAVQRGDHIAFTELVHAYQDMAFGYAVAVVGDFHVAQDVVQEAFIIAYFNLSRLHTPAAFPGWLRSIVRFQCARILRKQRYSQLRLDDLHEVPASMPTPDEQAATHETRDQTLEAIRALPEAHRAVVILFYVYDYTQQEVAAFLGIPVTTVNNRLHAARKQLKRRLLTMAKDTFAAHGLPDDFATNVGNVIATHGPIIDVRFAPGEVPPTLSRLVDDTSQTFAAEVVQRIGKDTVRCVLLAPHQSVVAGRGLRDTGTPATEALDESVVRQLMATVKRPAPPPPTVLETGIKVIDFFCPYVRGGTVGVFGDMRAGKVVVMEELLHNLALHNDDITLFAFAHTEDIAQSWYGHVPASHETVQTVYVPTANPADVSFVHSFNDFDAITYLARSVGEQQIWPAIDPLASRSRALIPTIVGEEHYMVAQAVRELLNEQAHKPVEQTEQGQIRAARAQKIRAFCSQPFFVAEPYTGRPGQFVPRAAAIQGFKELLAGAYDDVPVEAFLWCGTIEQAVEKAQSM